MSLPRYSYTADIRNIDQYIGTHSLTSELTPAHLNDLFDLLGWSYADVPEDAYDSARSWEFDRKRKLLDWMKRNGRGVVPKKIVQCVEASMALRLQQGGGVDQQSSASTIRPSVGSAHAPPALAIDASPALPPPALALDASPAFPLPSDAHLCPATKGAFLACQVPGPGSASGSAGGVSTSLGPSSEAKTVILPPHLRGGTRSEQAQDFGVPECCETVSRLLAQQSWSEGPMQTVQAWLAKQNPSLYDGMAGSQSQQVTTQTPRPRSRNAGAHCAGTTAGVSSTQLQLQKGQSMEDGRGIASCPPNPVLTTGFSSRFMPTGSPLPAPVDVPSSWMDTAPARSRGDVSPSIDVAPPLPSASQTPATSTTARRTMRPAEWDTAVSTFTTTLGKLKAVDCDVATKFVRSATTKVESTLRKAVAKAEQAQNSATLAAAAAAAAEAEWRRRRAEEEERRRAAVAELAAMEEAIKAAAAARASHSDDDEKAELSEEEAELREEESEGDNWVSEDEMDENDMVL